MWKVSKSGLATTRTIGSNGLYILYPNNSPNILKFKFEFQKIMKSSDNIRCIRKYQKKDGSITYHAEVRIHAQLFKIENSL